MCDPNLVTIYQLVDLDSKEIVYVGSSWQPFQRFRAHMNRPTNERMRDYFTTHRMAMEVLRTVPRAESHAAEVAAIHAALERGARLFNTHVYGWAPMEQLRLFNLTNLSS